MAEGEDSEVNLIAACKGAISIGHQTNEGQDRVSEECTRCQRYLEQAEEVRALLATYSKLM